jgi:predicted ArsR family transcriptional regulator
MNKSLHKVNAEPDISRRALGGISLQHLLGRQCARVFGALQRSHSATPAQVAELLQLTPNAVRRHLKRLMEAGLVTRYVRKVGRGRPAYYFQLSDRAHRLWPPALEPLRALAETALDDKKERERRKLASKLFARLLPGRTGRRRVRLSDLAEQLSHAGFMSTARAGSLCIHHCPFADLPHTFPELCAAERESIERALGAEVGRTAWRLAGDADCSYRVIRKT